MDKWDVERLDDAGKGLTSSKLFECDAGDKELKRKISQLKRNSKNPSKPPTTDPPQYRIQEQETQKPNNDNHKQCCQPWHTGNNQKLIHPEAWHIVFAQTIENLRKGLMTLWYQFNPYISYEIYYDFENSSTCCFARNGFGIKILQYFSTKTALRTLPVKLFHYLTPISNAICGFKDGHISHADIVKRYVSTINEVKGCLKDFVDSHKRSVYTSARKLLKWFNHLFTFIYYEGVESTNNLAERDIRPLVQWQTLCFDNRSESGAVLIARMLTVAWTCWFQALNPPESLINVILTRRTENLAPSFL